MTSRTEQVKAQARPSTPDSMTESECPTSDTAGPPSTGKKSSKKGKSSKNKTGDATSTVLNNMVARMRPNKADKEKGDKKKGFVLDTGVNILSKARVKQVKVDELAEDNLIIAVMGPTGSGKSSFINTTTGYRQGVGHTLESCTSDINVVKFSCQPIFPNDIYFVDTPGFDDTNKSDTEIFKLISNWLNKTYESHIKLSGLLYFHRISDNRMAGTPLKNLRMFEKLVGSKFHNIILTTTMWDEVDEETGQMREDELRSIYWKTMIDRGSGTARFLQTTQSAFQLLAPLLDEANKRETLLLQKEVTDLGFQLRETSAGQVLFLELEHLVKRQQEMLERIREEMKHPSTDEEQLRFLMEEYQKITSKLASTSKQVSELKISIGLRLSKAVKSVFGLQFLKSLIGLRQPKKNRPSAPVPQPPANAPDTSTAKEVESEPGPGRDATEAPATESVTQEASLSTEPPSPSSADRQGEISAEDNRSFFTAMSRAGSTGVYSDFPNDGDEKALDVSREPARYRPEDEDAMKDSNLCAPPVSHTLSHFPSPPIRAAEPQQKFIAQNQIQVASRVEERGSRPPVIQTPQAAPRHQTRTNLDRPDTHIANHAPEGSWYNSRSSDQTQAAKPEHLVLRGHEGSSSMGRKNSAAFPTGDRYTLCPRAQKWAQNGLKGGTQDIQWIRVCNPITKENTLVLVDTPGFNGDTRTDTTVLEMVGQWVTSRCPDGMKLSGIVFVCRIKDNRFTQGFTSIRMNMGAFRKLCGDRAFEKIILVTTMWDSLKDLRVGEEREKALEAGYWADMIKGGSHSRRFNRSEASAWQIIQDILEKQSGPTLEELQKFERRLSQTKVGQELLTHLQDIRARQSILIPTIASQITDSGRPSTAQATLDAEQGRLEAEAQKAFEEVKSLKVSFGEKISKFFSFGWKPHKRQLSPKN
ncbi:hypothetical protein NLJ89_g3078 [Agrocybe chaxingu]|uniref:G domain-containing protein n=1 Tax=Agrocybe chaxingu TaxID=84603 RepID=A0A9W8K5K9_9AGAR|nr:hypothetical protein NLJ89_g3078 [Agrocybe chaxingu]